ncbi:MAG: D-alanine--D-alanine ligase [Bacteroidales bacterium]|nr:D-alanine--D-alanine ligase [Bacteroidales bacterium]
MKKIKNIALVAGGNSAEREVSLRGARQVRKVLEDETYRVFPVVVTGTRWTVERDGQTAEIDKNDFSVVWQGERITFYCAYLMIHGTPGENGLLQGYFEMMHIPYSSCDVLVSDLTFNKYACKTYLKAFDIPQADAVLLRKGVPYNADEILQQLGLPCFVKPNNGGSSFGTTKVKRVEDFDEAVAKAYGQDDEVIVEHFISGTEVSNGVFRIGDKTTVLPVTEIVPVHDFFDVESKYQDGMSEEITPARISPLLTLRCQALSEKIYDALHCRGIVRMDYIIMHNVPYFLEVNTVPGMSEASIVPKQMAAEGLSPKQVFVDIIEDVVARCC